MKKFTNSIFLSIALAFLLSGCLTENQPIERETYRDIALRIAQTSASRNTGNDDVSLRGASTPLYGISRPIPNREPLVLAHGDLFLVTAEGVIMRHYRINVGNAALNSTARTVGVEYLKEFGVTFLNVPGSVARVVIIGNYGGTLPTTGNINNDNFLGRTLNVSSQYNAWSVNLTNCPTTTFNRTVGGGTLPNGTLYQRVAAINDDNALYATTIHLAPTVARFEIAEIAGAGNIQSFTIDGIFMDGFYRQARINSQFIPNTRHTGGQDPDNFTATSHTTGVGTIGSGVVTPVLNDVHFGIHDWRTAAVRHLNWSGSSAASLVVRPDNVTTNVRHPAENPPVGTVRPRNNVWAYQVFARHYHTAPAANQGTPVPHIIIRLSNVRIIDGSADGALWNNNGVAFLTVRDFYFLNDNNVRSRLNYIRASRVYHIARIMFEETELDYRPNRLPIDVNVIVNLASWRRVDLGTII